MLRMAILSSETRVCAQESVPLTRDAHDSHDRRPPEALRDDPIAACDRLIALLERVLGIEPVYAVPGDDTVRVPLTRYLIAQLRMRIRPALAPGWPTHDPVHVARFSQHPEAYFPGQLGERWLTVAPSRLATYQRYRDMHPPRQSDDELARHGYRPAFATFDLDRPPLPLAQPATAAVFWDAPDFSTEEAQIYLDAVLDVVALADIVVMTVTDESYADDRGIALLRMLVDAGVRLYVVANKLPDNPELLQDIEDKLGLRTHDTTLTLPLVNGRTPEERLQQLMATPEAETLRRRIAQDVTAGPTLKRQGLAAAVDFLQRRLGGVLRPLTVEVEMAAAWEGAVERLTHQHLLERYRNEYMEGERYGEFNQTLVRLMALLEIPGVGPLIRLLSTVVRAPVRLASNALQNLWGGRAPQSTLPPEHEVLEGLIAQWLAALRAEAQLLASTAAHPGWEDLARRLDSLDFSRQLAQTFERAYGDYRQTVNEEIQRRAQEIYQAIAQRPWRLNILRGANLVVDATSIMLVIKSGGLNWSDAVLGPLLAGLRHALLEVGLDTYLQTQQHLLKQRQMEAIRAAVEQHLARPIRDLFPGTARAEELEAVRHDVAQLGQAATQVGRGE
jgi:hypothetical protein